VESRRTLKLLHTHTTTIVSAKVGTADGLRGCPAANYTLAHEPETTHKFLESMMLETE
jgi:hypothetical protein